MSRDQVTAQILEELRTLRADVVELKEQVATAMGFVRGAKYVISILLGLVTIGLIKLGFNFRVTGHHVEL